MIETGWLAALIVTPVFFDVWSQRVFEPDKLTLLRSIALVMVGAAVVVILERGLPDRKALADWLRTPLIIPVLLLSAAYALSSALSVDPYVSVTGGYNRLQGLATWAAYVTIFLCLVSLLRTRLQLDRFLYALILPSLPVGLYGIIQKFGKEIMPWQGNTSVRIASTMGNSIFVAAYLILTVPLTIVRLTAALRDLDSDEGNAAVLRVSAYLVLLAVQIMAVVFSQSRGPLLGLLGGLFFLALLMATLRMSRRAMLGVIGVGAAVAAFLVVFNLPSSPLAPLRDVPYVGRMGRVFETDRGTGRVRVLIWGGAVQLIASDPYRMLVGWGPESMHMVYNPFYPPELGDLESRNASPDRSHNETFDTLVTTGIVGFLAYLFLYTSLFYYALKWLGLNDSRKSGQGFLVLWLGGGLVSVLGARMITGVWTFLGVALPAGMIAGLFAFVVIKALRGWQPPDRKGLPIVAALVAAIIAHFIEIHFGIAIAATRTLFFSMAGVLVVAGHLGAEDDEVLALTEPAPTTNRKRKRGRRQPGPMGHDYSRRIWVSRALLLVAILATMVFSFVVWSQFNMADAAARSRLFVLIWLFAMAWGIGSLVLGAETLVLPGATKNGMLAYLGITFGATAGYALLHYSVIVAGSRAGAATSTALIYLFYATLGALMLVWAFVLMLGDPAPAAVQREGFAASPMRYAVYTVVPVVVAFLIVKVNVHEVLADVHYKQGWLVYHAAASQAQAQGNLTVAEQRYEMAIQEYNTAISMDPHEDYYQLFKGKALLEEADTRAQAVEQQLPGARGQAGFSEYDTSLGSDIKNLVAQRDAAFNTALDALLRARDEAPLNTDHHANLGRAYQVWADRTYDAAKKAERFDLSRQYFEDAIAHSPHNAGLREELATTEYLAGNDEAARQRLQESLDIDPGYGRPYRLFATMAKDKEDWPTAEENYRKYLDSRDGKGDASAWSGLAFVLGKEKKYTDAIEANKQVQSLLGGNDPDTVRNLAILYNQVGDSAQSCRYAAQGLGVGEDPGLRQLGEQLGCEALGVPLPPVAGDQGTQGGAAPENTAPDIAAPAVVETPAAP